MPESPVILWFRKDLRLRDNPALSAAKDSGVPLLPLFILDEEGEGAWPAGGASRWWLHHSLLALDASLRALGSRLFLVKGSSETLLEAVMKDTGARTVFWNRRYEPQAIQRDGGIKERLKKRGFEAKSFNGSLLFEPSSVHNRQGGPFQVFTPFWRHCSAALALEPPAEKPRPTRLPPAPRWNGGLPPEALGLLPKQGWASGFSAHWTPGEEGAQLRLKRFIEDCLESYDTQRDLPAVDGTSGLSPHLHFGELSPRTIWEALRRPSKRSGVFPASNGEQRFLAELGWREFAYHLLFHFPDTPERPLRKNFEKFEWAQDPGAVKLRAWQRGRTGYPIVDAGMRQLWETGWMHNRVRMIAASFLVKHLRLPWQRGAEWFWDTLVDADLASNTLGWQWTAGCGADAAPYFRIFNPTLQGEKFDSEGLYVRRWVPELARVPAKWIHRPSEAPAEVLRLAGLADDSPYRRPLVEHRKACDAALAAFRALKGAAVLPP